MTMAIEEDGEPGDFFVRDFPGEPANFGLVLKTQDHKLCKGEIQLL